MLSSYKIYIYTPTAIMYIITYMFIAVNVYIFCKLVRKINIL